jgi:hypothetical protein
METTTITTTEMSNREAFTSKREISLALMEVTQDNFARYCLKLMYTLGSNVINCDEAGYFIEEFERYCKEENIDTTIIY